MSSKTTLEIASGIAMELFHITSEISRLPGDEDENFRIKSDSGESYILKISQPEVEEDYLNFQNEILKHINTKSLDFELPKVIENTENKFLSTITSKSGELRKVRLLRWLDGKLWAHANPKTKTLRYSLGEQAGKLTKALQDFDHQGAHRNFDWNLSDSAWTLGFLKLFSGKDREMVGYFQGLFSEIQPYYKNLPKSVIHNDVNDFNILVSLDLADPKVTGIIDFGDAVHTQTINDLAVLLAYAIMDVPDPLQASMDVIKGYTIHYSFSDEELKCLYPLVAMRLVTTVIKAAIRKAEDPTNEYHVISEKPAWAALTNWRKVNHQLAYFSFRQACGFTGHPFEEKFESWAINNKFTVSNLFPTSKANSIHHLDLSVSSKWIGHQKDFNNLDIFQFKIEQLQKQVTNKILAGGYLEPRALYTSSEYDKQGNSGPESRTIHLGVDFWLPSKTPVHALFDGEVVIAVNDAGNKEYGGLIVLKHQFEGFKFYTLYGHLTVESATKYFQGDVIKKGDCIAVLGNHPENGNWAPHLHFQIMLSLTEL